MREGTPSFVSTRRTRRCPRRRSPWPVRRRRGRRRLGGEAELGAARPTLAAGINGVVAFTWSRRSSGRSATGGGATEEKNGYEAVRVIGRAATVRRRAATRRGGGEEVRAVGRERRRVGGNAVGRLCSGPAAEVGAEAGDARVRRQPVQAAARARGRARRPTDRAKLAPSRPRARRGLEPV